MKIYAVEGPTASEGPGSRRFGLSSARTLLEGLQRATD